MRHSMNALAGVRVITIGGQFSSKPEPNISLQNEVIRFTIPCVAGHCEPPANMQKYFRT
jgi:hypothetical protein